MTHWGVWCVTTESWYTENGEVWLGTTEDCVLKASDLNLSDYETRTMSGCETAMRYEVRPFKADV